MSEVVVVKTYDCGCGFRTEVEKEAIAHSRSAGHSMTIHGRVLSMTDEPIDYPPVGQFRR